MQAILGLLVVDVGGKCRETSRFLSFWTKRKTQNETNPHNLPAYPSCNTNFCKLLMFSLPLEAFDLWNCAILLHKHRTRHSNRKVGKTFRNNYYSLNIWSDISSANYLHLSDFVWCQVFLSKFIYHPNDQFFFQNGKNVFWLVFHEIEHRSLKYLHLLQFILLQSRFRLSTHISCRVAAFECTLENSKKRI